MKRFYTLLYIAWISMAVFAQNPRDLLDKAAATLKHPSGVVINFQVKQETDKGLSSPTSGVIALKGSKFRLEAQGITTWFDGKTQWSYLPDNQEVNISEPTQQELSQVNPTAILNLYKKGYTYKLGNTTAYSGKPVVEVDLLAEKQNQDIWQVVLLVSKDTYQPVQLKIRPKNSRWLVLNITSLKQQALQDSYFTFQKSDAPDAEMVDLR